MLSRPSACPLKQTKSQSCNDLLNSHTTVSPVKEVSKLNEILLFGKCLVAVLKCLPRKKISPKRAKHVLNKEKVVKRASVQCMPCLPEVDSGNPMNNVGRAEDWKSMLFCSTEKLWKMNIRSQTGNCYKAPNESLFEKDRWWIKDNLST